MILTGRSRAPRSACALQNRGMRLRSYLALLVLGAMVPLAIFGAIVGAFFVQHDRASFLRALEDLESGGAA